MKKMIYEKPELEMLRFVVEAGFAQSSLTDIEDGSETDTEFGNGGTYDNWD